MTLTAIVKSKHLRSEVSSQALTEAMTASAATARTSCRTRMQRHPTVPAGLQRGGDPFCGIAAQHTRERSCLDFNLSP